ncbi:MAG: protein-tyrosine-phosphatase [Actinobacteria bacterium]|nr:MAG: protein-tyrosine-phosphatase [Actinomycetota bacterium]
MFVDVHSHVVPSGDDGAKTVAEGLVLCREAVARGTNVLFATPHVWPELTLTEEREASVRLVHADMALQASTLGLDLRLGFELTPSRELLSEDPARYTLGGLPAVLMELPFSRPLGTAMLLAEAIEAAGLTPVIAHPERSDQVLERPEIVAELAARGWLLQINATSLLGYHGPSRAGVGWSAVEEGFASLVASDGHRLTRPPFLDDAYDAVCARVGEEAARPLFDGSALPRLELAGGDGLHLAQRG